MPNTLTHRGRTHAAIDIYAARGAAIVAPVSGVIMSVGVGTSIGGNWVQLRGDDGIVYYFAHMDSPSPMRRGQRVSARSYLGAVGNSGSAQGTSPHLHFSMKYRGKPINPVRWLEGGTVPNPADYPNYNYTDPFAAAATDPFFVGDQGSYQPEEDQMRSTITEMLDTMSNAVAGGQRSGYGDELVQYVTEGVTSDDDLPTTTDELGMSG